MKGDYYKYVIVNPCLNTVDGYDTLKEARAAVKKWRIYDNNPDYQIRRLDDNGRDIGRIKG